MNKSRIVIHVGFPKVISCFLRQKIFYKYPNLIISDENLSGNINHNKIGIIQRYILLHGLKAIYPNARIIVCVRKNKESWMHSMYSQYVKIGGMHSYKKWYNDVYDNEFTDYKKYLKIIRSLFKDIYVLYYENFLKDKEKEIKKLCDFIGIPVPNDIDYNDRVNKKWTGLQLYLGRLRSFLFMISKIMISATNYKNH